MDKNARNSSAPGANGSDREIDGHRQPAPATPKMSHFRLILDEPLAEDVWIENPPDIRFDSDEYLDESA